jgi:enterochelin esterase family protein
VVHDGRDYLRFSEFKEVLDNLIHRLEIAPMIVALVDPVGNRLEEYADNEPHARFLTEELVPAMEDRFPLAARPGARGLMGASFGAVAALSTACRYPGFYGRLLLQSGSFAFTDIGANRRGPVFDPVVQFVNRFRETPVRASEEVFVSCGIYESLIYENRSLVPVLQDAGMKVRFVEARDGHNWVNWRDRLREGLSSLFPGPLWMVYE